VDHTETFVITNGDGTKGVVGVKPRTTPETHKLTNGTNTQEEAAVTVNVLRSFSFPGLVTRLQVLRVRTRQLLLRGTVPFSVIEVHILATAQVPQYALHTVTFNQYIDIMLTHIHVGLRARQINYQ
jgi:hypothetical protein